MIVAWNGQQKGSQWLRFSWSMTMKSFVVALPICWQRTLTSKSSVMPARCRKRWFGYRRPKPDVAVLDVRLPDGNGIELCRDLLSELPELRCLMLTSFTSDEAMLEAILAGASGYVVKDIRGMELAQAIKDVGAGKSLLDNRAAAALMSKLRGAAEHKDPLSGLTERERTLLGLLSEGLTNRQIAARMFLAEKTVKNYVSRLLAKLGMERRTQAAVFASKLDRQSGPPTST